MGVRACRGSLMQVSGEYSDLGYCEYSKLVTIQTQEHNGTNKQTFL
jgi:hypothetical protein